MPSESEDIVVDTNILFSALLSAQSDFAEILLKSSHRFFICEQVLVELFRRKEKLLKLSRLSETDLAHFYHIIIRRVILFKEDLISTDNLINAFALCRDIDEDDTTHVALALELDGLLWTGDKRLKEGLQLKGFNRFFQPGE